MVIIRISLVRHVLPGTSPSVTLVPYPSCPSFPQNMLILHGYCIPVNCMGTCVRSKQVICEGSIRRVCKCSMLNTYKHIFISMIGFVTWPPFSCQNYYKGGQVTKPITLVKICYKLLYIILKELIFTSDIKLFGCTYTSL